MYRQLIVEYGGATVDNSLMSDFSNLIDGISKPRRRQSRRSPACRIVVPLNAEAARVLGEIALTNGLTLRLIVLRALSLIGVKVASRHLVQRNQINNRLSGRKRINPNAYAVSIILPSSSFSSMKAMAQRNDWTINQIVRIALREAGLPILQAEIDGDKRCSARRTQRRHYACQN